MQLGFRQSEKSIPSVDRRIHNNSNNAKNVSYLCPRPRAKVMFFRGPFFCFCAPAFSITTSYMLLFSFFLRKCMHLVRSGRVSGFGNLCLRQASNSTRRFCKSDFISNILSTKSCLRNLRSSGWRLPSESRQRYHPCWSGLLHSPFSTRTWTERGRVQCTSERMCG